jgi:hypothetical protein
MYCAARCENPQREMFENVARVDPCGKAGWSWKSFHDIAVMDIPGKHHLPTNMRPMTGNRCSQRRGEASKFTHPSGHDIPHPY